MMQQEYMLIKTMISANGSFGCQYAYNLYYNYILLIHIGKMQSSYSYEQDDEIQVEDSLQMRYKITNHKNKKWGEGLWTQIQKLRYVAYILYNKDFLNSKLQRRKYKIFKQMSNFIGTRNPNQCRSQNQKMFRRYKSLHKIVLQSKKEFGQLNFQAQYQKCSKQIGIKLSIEKDQRRSSSQNNEIVEPKKAEVSQAGIQTDGQVMVMMSKAEYDLWNSFNQTLRRSEANQQILNNFYFKRYFF